MDAHSSLSLSRTVALVGLMGAGKSAIGKRLAMRLGLSFVDADDEIERAAGCSIAEFFEKYGESDFRAGERRRDREHPARAGEQRVRLDWAGAENQSALAALLEYLKTL